MKYKIPKLTIIISKLFNKRDKRLKTSPSGSVLIAKKKSKRYTDRDSDTSKSLKQIIKIINQN